MSLDLQELNRKQKLGDKKAKIVYALRKKTHLTLASILITNTTFNAGTAVFLAGRFSGLVAIVASTLLLVVFSELLPQAIFTRNALNYMYRLSPLIKIMIFFTYPISKPLQLILDRWFGPESNKLHSRHELGMIINEHKIGNASELDDDEIEIIRGALQLSEKQVIDIMTPIDKVFWLKQTDYIDHESIDLIKTASFSRIPIFSKSLRECFGVLLMKDLVDIDFDNQTLNISEAKLHRTKMIGSKTALDTMFRHFITARTHLMPVTMGGKIIGIITIEDLIEEIIGHEIIDESDKTLV